jgi:xanthine/uracil/vitamin C permease (AzgA family)
MFVVSLGMIPLLEEYLGLPYEVALAFVFVCGVGFMLPALLGVPLVPGWITAAIPVVIIFLGDFEPGPEAIRALVALQFLVFGIFLVLGLSGLGDLIVRNIPNSLKGGILIGAGIAAILEEIQSGGRVAETPISLILGSIVALYLLFSTSFKAMYHRARIVRFIANYGIVPAIVLAIIVGWAVREYPLPEVEWGITQPAVLEMWSYLPFTVGFPGLDLFLLALPTAVICYVIAYGDIIVGTTLVDRANEIRQDEYIDTSPNRIHLVTAIRNLLHALFAPYPGLAGPIWTPVTAVIAERYKYGRNVMDSIFSGAGTFWISGFLALFILPLVSTFQPVLPIALSLTLILTGYISITVGIEQLSESVERGVAGVMAVVLAVHGAALGLLAGALLYLLVEHRNPLKLLLGRGKQEEADKAREEQKAAKEE